MTGLDVFTFIVFGVIIGSIIIAAYYLGRWPGRIAAERNHHQAEAIRVCGWLGLLTLGILWPLAFIWAHTNSVPTISGKASDDMLDTITAMSQRIKDLEAELALLRSGKGAPS